MGKKSEEMFPVGNWGKQKYFCAVETSQERRVGPQRHLHKGEFPHLGKHGHN